MTKRRDQAAKSETEEILSEIRQSQTDANQQEPPTPDQSKDEPDSSSEDNLKELSDFNPSDELHLKKTEESVVSIVEASPDSSPYTSDESDEESVVFDEKEVEDYQVSKWITLLDDLANPFTIDLSSVQAFSAMSEEEITDMFDEEEFVSTPQFRNGVRVYTRIFPEGVCLFGIDHDTFEQAILQYEERG